jgi:hypothetical protein
MRRVATNGKSSKKERKPPPHNPVFAVSSTLLRKKDKEVQTKMKELKLNLKSVSRPIKSGNCPLTERTKAVYPSHFKNVEHFCCLIEMYYSCIISMETPPKHAIPIKAEVLVLYLRLKFWDETKDLLDSSNETLKDGKGKAIKCVGLTIFPDVDKWTRAQVIEYSIGKRVRVTNLMILPVRTRIHVLG